MMLRIRFLVGRWDACLAMDRWLLVERLQCFAYEPL
jgi:hypothetical protein